MPKNITVSISDDLAIKMDTFKDVNWSEVCRMAISEYLEKKQPNNGEVVKNLERFLRLKLGNLTDEDKIAIRNDEIKRFSKRWGEPDVVESYDFAYPYVKLSKNQPIRNTPIKSKIFNQVAFAFYSMLSPEKLVEFNAEKWRDVAEGKVSLLVDALKYNGFIVGELFNGNEGESNCGLTSAMLAELLSNDEMKTAEVIQREFAFFGLFAVDKQDVIFITYRKEKLRP